jgi:hypothetical protein
MTTITPDLATALATAPWWGAEEIHDEVVEPILREWPQGRSDTDVDGTVIVITAPNGDPVASGYAVDGMTPEVASWVLDLSAAYPALVIRLYGGIVLALWRDPSGGSLDWWGRATHYLRGGEVYLLPRRERHALDVGV